jgi:hypothetical protein
MCQGSLYEWNPGGTLVPSQAIESIQLPLGKANRNVALIRGEDIDSIMGTRPEMGKEVASVIDTDKHERRVARYGCEGINGQPVWNAVFALHRRDGDARRKAGAGFPEEIAVEYNRCHASAP